MQSFIAIVRKFPVVNCLPFIYYLLPRCKISNFCNFLAAKKKNYERVGYSTLIIFSRGERPQKKKITGISSTVHAQKQKQKKKNKTAVLLWIILNNSGKANLPRAEAPISDKLSIIDERFA